MGLRKLEVPSSKEEPVDAAVLTDDHEVVRYTGKEKGRVLSRAACY